MRIEQVPVALLAGGRATRLGAIARAVPKALLDVAGRPFIDHQLDLLHRGGIRRVVLCLGHLGDQIEQYLGDGASRGMELRYSRDGDTPAGTGGAVRGALPLLADVFWIMYGDSYMDIDYRGVLAHFDSSDAMGLMTVLRNDDQWDRSNVIFEEGRLLKYDKQNRDPHMHHIDYGVQLIRREALQHMTPGERCDLADVYRDMVRRGEMTGFEVHTRFHEIGTPPSLEATRLELAASSDGCRKASA